MFFNMQADPTNDNASNAKEPPQFSLQERFEFGRFSLHELALLAGISLGKLYGDIRARRLETFTHGRRRFVPGPAAKRYLRGDL